MLPSPRAPSPRRTTSPIGRSPSSLPAAALALALAAGLAPEPTSAQEAGQALRYELREAEPPASRVLTPGAEQEIRVPDVGEDRTPEQVVQGSGVTLRGPAGRPLTWDSATLRMVDGAPVAEGPGGTLVKRWPEPRGEYSYGAVRAEARRGERDATVAGREAAHWVLEAELVRDHPERTHRYRITSHLWILEELPFSWAPFGAHTTSVPAYDPRLREAMTAELEGLGLVARAVTVVEFELVPAGGTAGERRSAGSTSVRAFEIAALERGPAPGGPPGPVVDAAFPTALEAAVMGRPAATCAAADAGEAPAVVREHVPESHRPAVVDWLAGMCREQAAGLFSEMLAAEVEEAGSWAPVCGGAVFGEGPEAFARSVYSEENAGAFLEMLSAGEQRQVMDRIRPACERSGG